MLALQRDQEAIASVKGAVPVEHDGRTQFLQHCICKGCKGCLQQLHLLDRTARVSRTTSTMMSALSGCCL
jgi:hypothetical protein